ncbi:MAG: rRNA maturation RNase YbeY [bacterium]
MSAPKTSSDFEEIKVAVLGKKYDLSVAFLIPAEMQKITKERLSKVEKKDPGHISNVLSFPLSKTSGEILLCPKVAEKECASFSMDKRTYLAFLFIHGCFHLKGLKHGATMESEEKRIMKRFGLRPRE